MRFNFYFKFRGISSSQNIYRCYFWIRAPAQNARQNPTWRFVYVSCEDYTEYRIDLYGVFRRRNLSIPAISDVSVFVASYVIL